MRGSGAPRELLMSPAGMRAIVRPALQLTGREMVGGQPSRPGGLSDRSLPTPVPPGLTAQRTGKQKMNPPHDALLQEQLAYYRARAGEYDEWFLRQGRY